MIEKIELMNKVFINESTKKYLNQGDVYMGNTYGLEGLDIYRLIANALSLDDWYFLTTNNVFISLIFSPGCNSKLNFALPQNSNLITIDYNSLKTMAKQQQVAIILHEIGHAVNPTLTGQDGELAADDYAIIRLYGEHLKSSLEKFIIDDPINFDKEITHIRISRINPL
jgi:hypothetical protein